MLNKLFEELRDLNLKDEKQLFFLLRTQNHINLVREAALKIVAVYPELEELIVNVVDHDKSKFEEPEKIPYIELTWNRRHGGELSDEMQDQITKATLHHIKTNPHHPEYHLKDETKVELKSTNRDESIECVDAFGMDELSLAEMVSDWQAVSVELGTNTARQWFNDVKDVRWAFTDKQEEFIDKLLKVFEVDNV